MSATTHGRVKRLQAEFRGDEARMSRSGAAGLALVAALVAGCATSPPARQDGSRPGTSQAQPPRPSGLNLSGFPPAFQEGYGDGCDSARGGRRRDEGRYKADTSYKTGWDDGYSICASRK